MENEISADFSDQNRRILKRKQQQKNRCKSNDFLEPSCMLARELSYVLSKEGHFFQTYTLHPDEMIPYTNYCQMLDFKKKKNKAKSTLISHVNCG